jgi:hypothetical protein
MWTWSWCAPWGGRCGPLTRASPAQHTERSTLLNETGQVAALVARRTIEVREYPRHKRTRVFACSRTR